MTDRPPVLHGNAPEGAGSPWLEDTLEPQDASALREGG